jgi:3-hexulose-6-phosphate synthase
MAKLQVAIDLLSTKEALELAAKVAPYVDIIELGTPLIKSEGLAVIKAMKAAHPDKLVFADFKTADTGELEAGMAFGAGADLVTILGSVDDATIIGAVKAAKNSWSCTRASTSRLRPATPSRCSSTKPSAPACPCPSRAA